MHGYGRGIGGFKNGLDFLFGDWFVGKCPAGFSRIDHLHRVHGNLLAIGDFDVATTSLSVVTESVAKGMNSSSAERLDAYLPFRGHLGK